MIPFKKHTMTVGETIEKLKTYPSEMPFMATWESVHAPIKELNFSVSQEYDRPVLIVDVEDYNS